MNKILTTLFTILALTFTTSTSVLAQDDAGGGGEGLFEDGFRDGIIVASTAVGGAVLGLSTLSFVDEPKDHLKNILVGAAIGIIVGVGLVAYMQATKSKDTYDSEGYLMPESPELFTTTGRRKWHSDLHQTYNKDVKKDNNIVGYQFSF